MLESSCLKFIAELSSKSPVPGGGGASALVGSVGVALGSMVGNLTAGKEKYKDVEEDIRILLNKSEALIMRLNQLVEKDAAVFGPLAKAYGMPVNTSEEREEKDRVLQEALVNATKVPLAIAECSLEGIRLLDQFARKGSRLAVSDAGVGAVLCKSAIQGSKLNVLINLKLMKNETLKTELKNKMDAIEAEGLKLADQVYRYVEEQLCC
ncbi:MAG TPA: cyclodeaminase/cyclohydrolase family protein [Anaerovoracaceae bacterium]|nr:cyclodeaminase/cyclohydrolase family protein [Anaerovoracaceae bacterium]